MPKIVLRLRDVDSIVVKGAASVEQWPAAFTNREYKYAFAHSYLVYIDENGNEFILGAYASDGILPGSKLYVNGHNNLLPVAAANEERGKNYTSLVVYEGLEARKNFLAMQLLGKDVDAGKYGYKALAQNCNTFTYLALKAIGIESPETLPNPIGCGTTGKALCAMPGFEFNKLNLSRQFLNNTNYLAKAHASLINQQQVPQAQQNLAENFVMQRAANLHSNTAYNQRILNNTACFKVPFQPRQSSMPNYVEKNCGGSCSSTSLGMSEFWHTLEYTNLIPSYNNYNHASRMYCPANSHGNIGGVATQVATITDLIDSEAHALADEYYLCFPAEKLDFPDWMLQQVQQELADAFFKHKTLPFFSLHFNQAGFLYPIIHPAYQNTLIGEVIGLLDYWMKGYLNGGIFDAEFLKQWHQTANCDENYLRSAMIDLKQYCKQQQESQDYLSLRELASRYGNKDKVQHTKSVYRQPFQTSFRIIAYQDKVERHANILMPHADFKIESSVELMPDYQQYVAAHIQEHGTKPPEYQQSLECYELFAAEIKENMPKLPFCRDYFKLLGFVNSLCYFYTTLDKMGKKPIINNEFIPKTYTFPKSLPPIPIRYYTTHQLPITLEAILQDLSNTDEKIIELDQNLFSLFAMKKVKALPEPLLKAINLVANRLIMQGLHDKIAAEELSTLNPDEMVRITTEISNVFLILSSQYANEVHRALNRILKMFKLELSQQQVQGLTNLVLTDKIQQIQQLFANHLQVILSRWEGNPAVVKTELFTETQKDLHAALQGKINKIEEFEAQELRRNLAAELASHDAYTNGVIAKFNVDNKELLTATTDSLEQQKIAETAQEIASIKALIQKQATEEQNKLLANKQQLESNLQILEGNITYLQKNKAEQLASVPAHLRAANQANIDKFIIEEDAKIAAQQVNIDNFREMLVKTNNILATVLADADALIQTKIQKITENKQAIFDEKINNLAALRLCK